MGIGDYVLDLGSRIWNGSTSTTRATGCGGDAPGTDRCSQTGVDGQPEPAGNTSPVFITDYLENNKTTVYIGKTLAVMSQSGIQECTLQSNQNLTMYWDFNDGSDFNGLSYLTLDLSKNRVNSEDPNKASIIKQKLSTNNGYVVIENKDGRLQVMVAHIFKAEPSHIGWKLKGSFGETKSWIRSTSKPNFSYSNSVASQCTQYPKPKILINNVSYEAAATDYLPGGVNVKQGAEVKLCIPAQFQLCDDSTDYKTNTEVRIEAASTKSSNLTYDETKKQYCDTFTFSTIGKQSANIYVKDTRYSAEEILRVELPFYVEKSNYDLNITTKSNDGYIARRLVAITAAFKQPVANGKYTYTWVITDGNGKQIKDSTGKTPTTSTNNYSFIPLTDGWYQVSVMISGDGLPAIGIDKTLSNGLTIYAFSKPVISFTGDKYPKSGGSAGTYYPLLIPTDRSVGEEETSAKCDFTLYKPDGKGNPITKDTVKTDVPCKDGFVFTPPSGALQEMTYKLEVVAKGYNKYDSTTPAYTTQPYSTVINVQPATSVQTPTLKVLFDYYKGNESYAFRQVTIFPSVPGTSSCTYSYNILDNNQNAFTTPPGYSASSATPTSTFSGNPGVYTFTTNAMVNYLYHAKVTAVCSGLTTSLVETVPLPIYLFPTAKATINLIGQTVYDNTSTTISLALDKSRAEDLAADVTWTITYIENGTTKTFTTVTKKYGSGGNQLTVTFPKTPEDRQYTIKASVTGKNGTTTVYNSDDLQYLTVRASDPYVAPTANPQIANNAAKGSIVYMDLSTSKASSWSKLVKVSIDWGDGNIEEIKASDQTNGFTSSELQNIPHTYKNTGKPTIKVIVYDSWNKPSVPKQTDILIY